jgi:toxin ParE1/3/4
MNGSLVARSQIPMPGRRLRIILTRSADEELGEILLYSGRHWGVEHRSTYETLIRDTLHILTRSPLIGRSRGELSVGLRSHSVGSHVVFYWPTDEAIVVAHILHARQDPGRETWQQTDEE